MPDSEVATVADAVLKELDSTTLTLGAVYSRSEDTDLQLKDVDVLHVDVIDAGHGVEPASRGKLTRMPKVQIIIRKRLNRDSRDDDQTVMDRLRLLVEEIEQLFFQRRLDEYDAVWHSMETMGPSDLHYRTWRQFTSVITIFYKTFKEV